MSEYVIAIAAIAAVFVIGSVAVRRRQSSDAPPLGIVLLLGSERTLDGVAIAEVFGRVTGAQFNVVNPFRARSPSPSDLPAGNAVLGGPVSFLVQFDGVLFVVNNVRGPYRELGSAKAGEDFDDACAAKAVREHRAWLSAEVLHPEAASPANYRIVARAIAEFLSPEDLALFHPQSRTLAPVRPAETIACLRGVHPIRDLFGVPPEKAETPNCDC